MVDYAFEMPPHIFGEAIIETSNTHNLFLQYSNTTYSSVLDLSLIIANSVSS
jgi:hypothetical protein